MLQYYELGSLKSWLKKAALTQTILLQLLLDVARGLDEMHGLGFAHCDIKTDNILVTNVEKPTKRLGAVITDLGVSRVVTDRTLGVNYFKPQKIFGMSAHYAAPELAKIHLSRASDDRAPRVILAGDVYALGVVMQQLLARTDYPWMKPSGSAASSEKFFPFSSEK